MVVGCSANLRADTRHFDAIASTTYWPHHDLPNGIHMATLPAEWSLVCPAYAAFDSIHSIVPTMCDTVHPHSLCFRHYNTLRL